MNSRKIDIRRLLVRRIIKICLDNDIDIVAIRIDSECLDNAGGRNADENEETNIFQDNVFSPVVEMPEYVG